MADLLPVPHDGLNGQQAISNSLNDAMVRLRIAGQVQHGDGGQADTEDNGGGGPTPAEPRGKKKAARNGNKRQRNREKKQHEREVRYSTIRTHFATRYGGQSESLEAWQTLCRDCGVEEGGTIAKCRKIIKALYINIDDFVTGTFERFPTHVALREYSVKSGKIFPLRQAKRDELLRCMLQVFF